MRLCIILVFLLVSTFSISLCSGFFFTKESILANTKDNLQPYLYKQLVQQLDRLEQSYGAASTSCGYVDTTCGQNKYSYDYFQTNAPAYLANIGNWFCNYSMIFFNDGITPTPVPGLFPSYVNISYDATLGGVKSIILNPPSTCEAEYDTYLTGDYCFEQACTVAVYGPGQFNLLANTYGNVLVTSPQSVQITYTNLNNSVLIGAQTEDNTLLPNQYSLVFVIYWFEPYAPFTSLLGKPWIQITEVCTPL